MKRFVFGLGVVVLIGLVSVLLTLAALLHDMPESLAESTAEPVLLL